ncbi:1226_t:CDS:2, partial [Entrophospora sp. SA101]
NSRLLGSKGSKVKKLVENIDKYYTKYINMKLIEDYEERLSKPPIVLPSKIRLDVLNDYYHRPVETKGEFRHDQEILLGPRSINNKPGYYLITPLERKDDGGWISKDKVNPKTRPLSQTNDIVTIKGILKKPEKNEWIWNDIDTMAESTNAQPIMIEQSLDTSPFLKNKLIEDGIPVGKEPSIELRNTHLQYAITWYSLSIATTVLLYLYIKKPPSGYIR